MLNSTSQNTSKHSHNPLYVKNRLAHLRVVLNGYEILQLTLIYFATACGWAA